MHLIILLAVVSVRLHVVVSAAVAELHTERIVVHRLDDRSFPAAIDFPHLADVTQMVTVEVAERKVVLAGIIDVFLRLTVALVKQVLVYPAVLQRKASAEQIVRGIGVLNFVKGKFPHAANGDGDVRHRRLIDDAQFLARGAIDILRHVAVGELDTHGVVPQVVVYPRYLAPCIAHEGACVVVGEGILPHGHPVEVSGTSVGIPGGIVPHACEHVALVRHIEIINQAETAMHVIHQSAASQTGDVAVAVVIRILVEVVPDHTKPINPYNQFFFFL